MMRSAAMNRLLTRVLLVTAALGGFASAQYQYGYDPAYQMWAYPYGFEGLQYPGYGWTGYGADPMAAMDAIGQQLDAAMQENAARLAYYEQQMAEQQAQIQRYFIDLYRTTTGDLASPDATALYWGQVIHCQRNPVDCEAAARNSQASAQALAAQNEAFQARMQQQSAAFDAWNASWRDQQAANDRAHESFVNGVILGVEPYTNSSGQTQMLPFAPSQNSSYQSPAGHPLYFDASSNVWYEVRPDGSYTPYFGGP